MVNFFSLFITCNESSSIGDVISKCKSDSLHCVLYMNRDYCLAE